MLTNVVFSSLGTNGSYSVSISTDQRKKETKMLKLDFFLNLE